MSENPTAVRRQDRLVRGAVIVAAVATTLAIVNRMAARATEARNPPRGRFISVGGLRLHYREAGEGPPVLLLHGNGVASDDWLISGLMQDLARDHRVIAIDRPGFGWSERPRGGHWTAHRQAELVLQALEQLDVRRALVVGHSWGSLVAAEMGLLAPGSLAGLVLMSGYWRPTPRLDAILLGGPATPVVGDLMRHTVTPPLAALAAPMVVKHLFAPAPVSERFSRHYPIAMSLRPSQLGASAAESAMMVPAAARLERRVGQLAMSVLVIAGAKDRLVSSSHQSEWLAEQLPDASYVELPEVGHMIHYTAPDAVLSAIRTFEDRPALGSGAKTLSIAPAQEPAAPIN